MKSLLALVALVAAVPALAAVPPLRALVQLDRIGDLQLGDSIEKLPMVSRERKRFCKRHKAQLSVFYFDESLPKQCMNLECGLFARQVLARGGVLVGGNEKRLLSGLDLEGAGSLLLVTDPEGKVTKILRGAQPSDLSAVLSTIN